MKPQRYLSYLLSGLLVFVAAAFYGAQAAPTNDFPTSRTPVAWPFAWDSIWNMPIGAGAVYVPARIRPGAYGLYAEEDILILEPEAPLVNVIAHDADWDPNRKRCDSIVSPTQVLFANVPVPGAFSTEPNGYSDLSNHSAAILMPDGLTIRQTQPLHRCGANGPVVSQYNYPDDNIKTGNGIDGAHGGSAMSSMGGVIRLGELQPNSTLRHALKLVIDSRAYTYYDPNDETPGYRWPARWSDASAPVAYGGQEPALEMGALLALKPDFLIDNLRTEPAKIVARALRDYGGYVVDSTGWDAYYLTVEWGPKGRFLDEFEAIWGFPFISPQPASCTNVNDNSCRWSKDMADIFTSLHVVNNNLPQSIGGPGARLAPCAPPFNDGSGGAPEYCPRSGNQPSTPPAGTATPTTTRTATPTTAAATATPTRTPVQTATCGNGIIEALEACDDGNRTSGDGCTSQCLIEQSCYDPGNTFSFFTWSDSYGAAGDGGAIRVLRDAVNRTLYPNRVLPRFWISPGDIPYVPGIEQVSVEDINEEISGNNYPFTCAVGNRKFPLFVALGNHDVDGEPTDIATKLAYWSNQIGPQVDKTLVGIQNFKWGPDNGYDARTTYSFDYKNTHFVVYNQYYGDPDYPTPNPVACVRPTLYDWIDQDLTATTRPIKIIIGHEPAWSYCSNAPGYNGCINHGNDFTEDLLDPNKRPRPHSTSGQAWLEDYGKHWGDSLEDAKCPTINGQEGRGAFWQMLAKHKAVAHMVGHTHTYSSRLVDADGPRNDAPVTQEERNRRAYGKTGEVFANTAGVWEVDSAQAHNSAGTLYILVTVRDNRVTFEAWDQMGIGANEEPFRLVESWHVDVEGAAPPTLQAGDCNSDGRVDAGDLSACAREIFDGDGNLATNAPQGSFAGATTCDANTDTFIDAGDIACTARKIFNSAATCTNARATPVSSPARLTIANGLSGAAGAQVTAPVVLTTNGEAVTSVAFSLHFDANYLSFDPTDRNNDGIPDALADQLPANAFRSVEVVGDTINIALANLTPEPAPLQDGTLLTLTFQVKGIVGANPVTTTLTFANGAAPSLGSVAGGESAVIAVDGAIQVQPVAPAVEFHLPLIRRQ